MEKQYPSGIYRAGYAALIGRPNTGKSTLMNTLLMQKLAIVSPRPQTTRHKILGILNGEGYQIVLLDTPGLLAPRYPLQEAMKKAALQAVEESDVLLMLTEAFTDPAEEKEILGLIGKSSAQKIVVINKSDRVEKKSILPLIRHYRDTGLFREIIPVSALKNDNIDALIKSLADCCPAGDPFYPPDQISNAPERFFASEIIREQIFLRYGEEIPYACTVQVRQFRERPGRKDFIDAVITVERESQKGILIGREGRSLKAAGEAARKEIEAFLNRPVFLQLTVRVREKWRSHPDLLKEFGYL
ncbi:GTPase Era [bacterium]|nr:GTPase Era [bacterium]